MSAWSSDNLNCGHIFLQESEMNNIISKLINLTSKNWEKCYNIAFIPHAHYNSMH